MSDPESSGAETSAADAASTPSTPPNPAPIPSAFSNNRGSGLARGKRPASPPAPAAAGAPAVDYKPTVVSIVTAPTEYKNPFAPPAPAPAPADSAPAAVEPQSPAPAATPVPVSPAAEVPAPATNVTTEPVRIPYEEPVRSKPLEPEQKPELKILPPEATKHVEHNWESESFREVASQPTPDRPNDVPPAAPRPPRDDRRNDRPVFRPERDRRDDRPTEPRAEGRPAWNDRGRPPGNDVARAEPTPPITETPKPSGGFFAWVKSLFGGTPAPAPKPETSGEVRGNRDDPQEGQYRRRRRRGGRGRNFQGDQRGPRDGQSGGQPSGEQRGYGGGEQRGYGGENRHHGRRHRHHGGGGGGYRGGRPDGGPPSGS